MEEIIVKINEEAFSRFEDFLLFKKLCAKIDKVNEYGKALLVAYKNGSFSLLGTYNESTIDDENIVLTKNDEKSMSSNLTIPLANICNIERGKTTFFVTMKDGTVMEIA